MGGGVPLAREVHAIVKPPFHEIQPYATDVRLEPGVLKSPPSHVRKIIHIGNAGRAAREHLHHAPCNAGLDVRRGHLRLHGEYGFLKPTLK